MFEIIRTTVILSLLLGIPAIILAIVVFGEAKIQRVALATASTATGLVILIAERMTQKGIDKDVVFLLLLLAGALLPTIGLWRYLMPESDEARPTPRPVTTRPVASSVQSSPPVHTPKAAPISAHRIVRTSKTREIEI